MKKRVFFAQDQVYQENLLLINKNLVRGYDLFDTL